VILEDLTFPYRGYHGCPSQCRIRACRVGKGPWVVVATELDDNPGTSVTNMAEGIALAVWKWLERPEEMVWVEHYPDRMYLGDRPMLKAEFDLVEFERTPDGGFRRPRWRRISRGEAEALAGAPL
jgi:hypothetical protein